MSFQNINSGAVLAPIGVQAPTPPNFVRYPRRPTPHDFIPFMIGDEWEVYDALAPAIDKEVWKLVAKRIDPVTKFTVGTWVRFIAGNGPLLSLTGNIGPAVFGDINNNIFTLGGPGLTVTGTPVNNTLTWTFTNGLPASIYHTDDGNNVTPNAAGVVNVHGINGVVTTGTVGPNTINIGLTNGPAVSSFQQDDNGVVLPNAAGRVFNRSAIMPGGLSAQNPVAGISDNIYTSTPGATPNTWNISLTPSIAQPNTNATGTTGIYCLGGAVANPFDYITNRFMHNFGANNTFLGSQAGNLTLTGGTNCGIGTASLGNLSSGGGNVTVGVLSCAALTTGGFNATLGAGTLQGGTTASQNVAVGYQALTVCNSDANVAIGYQSGFNLTTGNASTFVGAITGRAFSTGSANNALGNAALQNNNGSFNIAIGNAAGSNYTGVESSNIIIGVANSGTTGESNTLRIAQTTSVGPGGLNAAYICGIYQKAVDPATLNVVVTDVNNKLGTSGTRAFFQTGTFTPTINFGGAPSPGAVYTLQRGNYTKIGNLVFITANVNLSALGAGVGIAEMGLGNLIALFPYFDTGGPVDCMMQSGSGINLGAGYSQSWGFFNPATGFPRYIAGPDSTANIFKILTNADFAASPGTNFTSTMQGFYYTPL